MTEQQFEAIDEFLEIMRRRDYKSLSEKDKNRIRFMLDAMWWGKQKLAGEFVPDTSCPPPSDEQVDAVYEYLTTQ